MSENDGYERLHIRVNPVLKRQLDQGKELLEARMNRKLNMTEFYNIVLKAWVDDQENITGSRKEFHKSIQRMGAINNWMGILIVVLLAEIGAMILNKLYDPGGREPVTSGAELVKHAVEQMKENGEELYQDVVVSAIDMDMTVNKEPAAKPKGKRK
jgi:hypothetical protein